MNRIVVGFIFLASLILLSGRVVAESYDLRVKGRGYFSVQLRDGSFAFTKEAVFHPDETGMLFTEDDYALIPELVVNLLASHRVIFENGVITSEVNGSEITEGNMTVFTFDRAEELRPIGAGLYRATRSSGLAIEHGPGLEGAGIVVFRK